MARSEVIRSEERLVWGDPIQETALEEPSELRNLLVRLRDEAHRFAITAHRKGRRRRDLEGVLDQVPGIGKKRKRSLMMRYATSARMLDAMATNGWELPGIPATVVARLRAVLEGDQADDAVTTAEAAAGTAPEAAAGIAPQTGSTSGSKVGSESGSEDRVRQEIDADAQDISEPKAEGDG